MITYLRVGDVIPWGDGELVVDYVNDSRARCQPLTRIPVTVHKVKRSGRGKDKKAEAVVHVVNRLVTGRDFSIAATCEPGFVLRRLSREEMEQFLDPQSTPTPAVPEPETIGWAKETDEMKTQVKINKVGKGRASFIHQLRNEGTHKAEAMEKAKKKFPELTPGLFSKVWDRKAKSVEAINGDDAPKPKAKKTLPLPKRAAAQVAEKRAAMKLPVPPSTVPA